MKLYVWICFLKYFWNSRHLVPPFKFQCGQIIRILFDKINLLFIVSTPKIELLMQPFVEIRIPYGITSDIFKILMFESLGNFLGGSIVLQLEPTQKLFSRKLYNPYTVFYHTFFDLKLVYEVGPESFLPPPTVKSALLNIKRKHLFFDFKFKAKYLAFISCLLEKPDLSVKTALKSIFRKSQVRSISEKFGLNLNAQIVCLSPSQWLNCFLEMLEVVPEKFHPS